MAQKTRDEAADLIRRVLSLLTALPIDAKTQGAAQLRRQIGALSATCDAAIRAGAVSAPLTACFSAAAAAGATQAAIEGVRSAIEAMQAVGRPARVIRALCIRLCLVEETRIIAASTYGSQEDANAALAAMNLAFSTAEDAAAGTPTSAIFRALVALHGAVTRDLTLRAAQLPRRVTYEFTESLPALALGNRFYADASRSDELVAENRAVHPLFLPRQVRALSA